MIMIIVGVLVALKIAGVGEYSWLLPIGIFIVYGIIKAVLSSSGKSNIGSDWHDRMFD